MKTKPILTLAALALCAFALSACGGSNQNDMAQVEPESPLPETTPRPEIAPDKGPGGTVEIVADPNGDLAYKTGDLQTEAGTVEITFTNEASLGHDVIVQNQAGEILGGTEVISEGSTVADVELEPGTYAYFCDVADHRQEGMEGKITTSK